MTYICVTPHEGVSYGHHRFRCPEPIDARTLLFVGDSHALATRSVAAVNRRPWVSGCVEHTWSVGLGLLRTPALGQYGGCACWHSGVFACGSMEAVRALLCFVCAALSRLLGPHAFGTRFISQLVVGLA